jgi:phosphoribosyl-AMP cyclohydrolase
MMAWMNRKAIEKTLDSGYMTYWSRSRSSFWLKGETSGNRQRLVNMRVDCDGDTLLCDVEPAGPACHTDRETCFYLRVDNASEQVVLECSRPSFSQPASSS